MLGLENSVNPGMLITFAVVISFSLMIFLFGKLTRTIAWRNMSRRKGQTLLVIIGSMVGTALIMGSFAINDTFNRVSYERVYENLGEIDFSVSFRGPEPVIQNAPEDYQRALQQQNFFTDNVVEIARNKLKDQFDGIIPIVVQPTPASDYNYELDRLTLIDSTAIIIALNPADLDSFGSQSLGNIEKIKQLSSSEVLVNNTLATSLELSAGNKVSVYINNVRHEFTIREIIENDGFAGYGGGNNVLMNYDTFTELMNWQEDVADQKIYTHLLFSSKGDIVSGDESFDADNKAIEDLVADLNKPYQKGSLGSGFFWDKDKHSAIEEASGSFIATAFVAISAFAIFAGVLLIINIYILLAEERKNELGILRALGMRRRMLLMVLFKEGMLYSILSTVAGILVGIGLGYFVIAGFGNAIRSISDLGVGGNVPVFTFSVAPTSIVISFIAGYLLTIVTVFIASLRIALLNIIRAIRNIPEPDRTSAGCWKIGLYLVLLVLSSLTSFLIYNSGNDEMKASVMLGGPTIIAFLFILFVNSINKRLFNMRIFVSLISLGSLAWSIYALQNVDPIKSSNENGSVAILIIFALLLIVSSIFLVVWNFEVITWLLLQTLGRVRALTAITKIATRYPALNRTTTGLTITMFSLVLFLVVAVTVNTNIFSTQIRNERDKLAFGFDAQVSIPEENRIEDFNERIDNSLFIDKNSIESFLDVKIATSHFVFSQEQTDQYFESQVSSPSFGEGPGDPGQISNPDSSLSERPVSLTFVTDESIDFLDTPLRSRMDVYNSDEAAFRAVMADNSLAILGISFDTTNTGGFAFWPDVKVGDTIEVEKKDGSISKKTVAGIVAYDAGLAIDFSGDIVVSGSEVDLYTPISSAYLLRFPESVDSGEMQRSLQKEFGVNNAQVVVFSTLIDVIFNVIDSIISILKSFLAFGLIVGVAGLGVIAYRTVFERRQQIGMMRALGFEAKHVLFSFLIEFSYIALLGIIIGVGMGSLGMWIAFPEIEGVTFFIPVREILTLSAIVYGASILFVIIPAIAAARLKPVEALRYDE